MDSEPVDTGSEILETETVDTQEPTEDWKPEMDEKTVKKPTVIKNISRYNTFEILNVPIKKGETITLTDAQENDERFMAIVNRGIELKMLEKA